jgi:transposase
MRTLQLHFPEDALPTLDTVLKQTKEARVFRRAQAVRDVVQGTRLHTVSDTLALTYSALRKWVHRFANQGPRGLLDRPRSGRPPTVTCALEQQRNRLVDQDPLEHGSLHSQWSCRELATVFARETGVQLGRESVRGVLKKTREAPAVPPGGSIPPRPTSPLALSTSLPWSTARVGARSLCSTKMKRSCGALPSPGWAGGAAPSALVCPPVL